MEPTHRKLSCFTSATKVQYRSMTDGHLNSPSDWLRSGYDLEAFKLMAKNI